MSKQKIIFDAIKLFNGKFTSGQIAGITNTSQPYVSNIINQMISRNELQKIEGTRPAQFKCMGGTTKQNEINLDVATRFKYVENLVDMVVNGIQPSMLLTGGAGIGKTHMVRSRLKVAGLSEDDYIISSGHSTPLGLYQLLHDNREDLIILDDNDSVFRDDIAINILKAALDSYDSRFISWHSSRAESMDMERCFEFTGRIIFISNLYIDRIDPAVRSRSFCYNLHLSTQEIYEYMHSILDKVEVNTSMDIKREVLEYLNEVKDNFRQFNLRTLIQSIRLRKGCNKELDWKTMVRVLADV